MQDIATPGLIYIYIYIYIYTYIHTHTHTHIHNRQHGMRLSFLSATSNRTRYKHRIVVNRPIFKLVVYLPETLVFWTLSFPWLCALECETLTRPENHNILRGERASHHPQHGKSRYAIYTREVDALSDLQWECWPSKIRSVMKMVMMMYLKKDIL